MVLVRAPEKCFKGCKLETHILPVVSSVRFDLRSLILLTFLIAASLVWYSPKGFSPISKHLFYLGAIPR